MNPNRQKSDRITKGLVAYLTKTGQLGLLPNLVKQALRQTAVNQDNSKAIVTSAIKLNPSQLTQLTRILSNTTKRPITVENRVNPEVIAGLHIQIGDKIIDDTIGSKLQNLGEKLVL